MPQSTLCVDNKKDKTELFFLVKKAGYHFSFLKRTGSNQKGAGRHALQKRPRQNIVNGPSLRFFRDNTRLIPRSNE